MSDCRCEVSLITTKVTCEINTPLQTQHRSSTRISHPCTTHLDDSDAIRQGRRPCLQQAEVSWFCFSLGSACKRKYFRFQRKIFELHLRGFLLVVVVLFVDQVRDQLVQSVRNSDRRVRIVFVYRLNYIFHTPYLPCRKLVVTSNTGPILVFPPIQPFGSDDFSSLGKLYSRHVTGSVNCKNSSVSFVMKYCPTSTVVRNPASVQNLITRSCCDNLSTRSWHLCNRSSFCAGSSVKGMCVFIALGTNNGLDCPATTSRPVLTGQVLHSSHTSKNAP